MSSHSYKQTVCQYLTMWEDREADGTFFSQYSLDELSVMRLMYSLYYVLQGVGGTVLQKQ